MEQCHRFLHSWKDTEPVLYTGLSFLKMKFLDITASKQLEIPKMSWFYTNDISVHSSNPKLTHLADTNIAF